MVHSAPLRKQSHLLTPLPRRDTERSDAATMDMLVWLESSGMAVWLRESETIWALPMVLTVHTLGLAVLVGSSWALDLRLLGVASRIPLAPLRTLFRPMWIGFWVNAVTGALLFASDAAGKGASLMFLAKMVFVAAGVVTLVRIERDVYGPGADPEKVSDTARILALVSIVAWAAAITSGRLLAYVVEF